MRTGCLAGIWRRNAPPTKLDIAPAGAFEKSMPAGTWVAGRAEPGLTRLHHHGLPKLVRPNPLRYLYMKLGNRGNFD